MKGKPTSQNLSLSTMRTEKDNGSSGTEKENVKHLQIGIW
jgi:hypothetical protein